MKFLLLYLLEILGNYNPHNKEINFKEERIKHWLSQGAKASETVHNLLIKKGVIKKAIAVFNQAIGLSTKNYKPYISLGRIYEENGRIDFAIEYYQKAQESCEANNNLQREDKKYIEGRLNILNNQSKKTQ